jgi:acetoin utilization deacetylase AcuC-like enzyme
MILITDQRCTAYYQPGHPECPQRVSLTVERLKAQTELELTWAAPGSVTEAQIERAHTRRHMDRLSVAMDFDADTATHPDIRSHAERSVGGALYALKMARETKPAFSLMRPPGHHATPERAMGFCYLNSIAIAVLEARATGTGRVAVFDFDVHHGNGTEDILLDREQCAYFSVHQFPLYPGTGADSYKNAHNYPVPPGASQKAWRETLSKALDDLKRFKPELVGVSAGFDAYSGDPLSDAALEEEDFGWLGRSLRDLGVPAFSVLEGGYSRELPNLILAYLRGLAGK